MARPSDKNEEKESDSTEKPFLANMVREFALTGLATFFMTEDSVRRYIKELKIPKELGSQLVDGIGKKKGDFYGLVAKEVGQLLGKTDFGAEFAKFLRTHKMQVEAKVSFEPRDDKEED